MSEPWRLWIIPSLFDSSGNAEADGNNPYFLFRSHFDDDERLAAEFVLNQWPSYQLDPPNHTVEVPFLLPKSNSFQTVDSNGNSASISDGFISMIETENNSSVFTTIGNNGISSIKHNPDVDKMFSTYTNCFITSLVEWVSIFRPCQ